MVRNFSLRAWVRVLLFPTCHTFSGLVISIRTRPHERDQPTNAGPPGKDIQNSDRTCVLVLPPPRYEKRKEIKHQ